MVSRYTFAIIIGIGLLLTPPAQGETKKLAKPKMLSSCQIMKVSGEAALSSGNYYAGDLYNGNSDIFITEISVYVSTKKMGEVFPRIYLCKVDIAPLTRASFGVNIAVGDEGSDYEWGIIEARGYEVGPCD